MARSETVKGGIMENKMKDLFSIKGKIALVTGGSRGIGEMIAAGFLSYGAKVYISSRKAEVCDATAKRLTDRYGKECLSIPADLCGSERYRVACHRLIGAGKQTGHPG